VNLQVQFTPEKPEESWVASASYVAPIADTPFTVVGYAVHSDSDVAAIGGINVLGTGDIVGLRGIYTNIVGEGEQAVVHQVTAGIDYKSFKEDLVVGSERGRTPIDYAPLTLQYSQARRTAAYDFNFGVGVNIGLRGLDATDEEFESKRFGARANWAVLTGNAGYTHKFENDWRVGGQLAVQYAGKPIISNEQFSAGGLDCVRGYYESQQIGDDGISLQLQVDTPSFHKGAGDWLDEVRVFGFVDGADMRTYMPLADQGKYASLASVGAGLTLRAYKNVNASVLLAAPLVERGSTLTDVGQMRAQARLWAEF
jgi:hemolysin activation/secretion protein